MWLALIGAIVAVVMPAYWYGQLPDTIPIHFGFGGEPDSYGHKATLWILPVVAAVCYSGLTVLARYPHTFNFPARITEVNAERQYANAVRMIRVLNVLITCACAYFTWSIIRVAMGWQGGLGRFAVLGFVLLVLGSTGYFVWKALKKT